MAAIEFLDGFDSIPLTVAEQIRLAAGRASEAERRKAWEQALASARIEGFEPSPEYLADVERNITGQFSDAEFEAKYTGQGPAEANRMSDYTGKVYQAASGQWAWVVYEGGEDVQRGAGYENEGDAMEALDDALAGWRGE